MKLIDMTNWRLSEHGVLGSKITVLYRAETKNNKTFWHCRCDCGKEFDSEGYKLRTGGTKSCGCSQKNRIVKDLTNQKFGLLTALYPVSNNTNRCGIMWHCKCECGNEKDILSIDLLDDTKSCGCLRTSYKEDNLEGQQFNRLTVLKYYGSSHGHGAIYTCQCSCGNKVNVRAQQLRSGAIQSCGCLSSLGEQKISAILSENNINFLHDKQYFKDLKSIYNGKLRYDFIIFNKNNQPYRLIEFDGEQHFYPIEHFGGDERFKIQQERDNIKNEYAWSHNIPIVRIPYTEKNITLETIMGDRYLVRPPQESENGN